VPLVGILASSGIQASFNSDLRAAARKQLQNAPAARIDALTVTAFCGTPRIRDANLEMCDTNRNIRLLGLTSAIAAALGIFLVGILRTAGIAARKSRKLLLLIFRPGLYFTAALLIVLVLMHAAIAVATIYYAEAILIGFLTFGVIAAIGAGALAGALGIARHAFRLVKSASATAVGVEVVEHEAPELWQRVRSVASNLDALMPEHVVLGLDPNFYVTEAEIRCLSGTCAGRTLYCSLPLLRILTVDEFLAIVGHELGHFKGEDTKFSRHFFPIYRGTLNSLLALRRAGGRRSAIVAVLPAIAVFGYFLECFSVAANEISRKRELEADKAGAGVTSSTTMAIALVKIHAFAGVWNRVCESVVELAREDSIYNNASKVYAEMALSAAAPPALEGIAAEYLPHPTDSHPPLAVRLDALGQTMQAVSAAALDVAPQQAAISLVQDAEAKEEEISTSYQKLIHQQMHDAGVLQYQEQSAEPTDAHDATEVDDTQQMPR
jgi:Zn-dependent protease with chaperone function